MNSTEMKMMSPKPESGPAAENQASPKQKAENFAHSVTPSKPEGQVLEAKCPPLGPPNLESTCPRQHLHPQRRLKWGNSPQKWAPLPAWLFAPVGQKSSRRSQTAHHDPEVAGRSSECHAAGSHPMGYRSSLRNMTPP